MISFDTSGWREEVLRRRPHAPDAIRAGMELLGVPPERWQDVADDIYSACVMHFAPLTVEASETSPRDIWLMVQSIADAAETIERGMAFLGREARPLPPNLGDRSVAVRYMRREIVRAMGERLVPPRLRDNDKVKHTLPHQFPESYINPNPASGSHSWEGQFQIFADTVRNIADHVKDQIGGKGLRRPANQPNFAAVRLVAELGCIFKRETGREPLAYRLPTDYVADGVDPGESFFTAFVKAVWPATEHAPITVSALKTAIAAAERFPG